MAGKTANVLFGVHCLHSLVGFLLEGVGAVGFAGDRAKKFAVFPGKPSHAGEKESKPVFFVTQKGQANLKILLSTLKIYI